MMADGIDVDPAPAMAARTVHGCDAAAEVLCTQNPPPRPVWAYCEQWHDMAEAVGWPESQGGVLSYVLYRESKCQPGATGSLVCSNGRCGRALGLTQLLGWSCPPNGCYDPWSNLSRAYQLWREQGWHPWCLRGDPVTGSC
jgi:hypothetical protein